MLNRQPGYTEPRYGPPRGHERGKQIGTMRRIGHNPRTGLGQYPSPSGVLQEVRRIRSRRVLIQAYGRPSWNTSRHTSPKPDAAGKVWVNAYVSQVELEDALAQRGRTYQLGRVGADPAMSDILFEVTGYNLASVDTVEVGPA